MAVADKDMARRMLRGEDREEGEAAAKQRVRRVSALNLLRGCVRWVLEGGIKA